MKRFLDKLKTSGKAEKKVEQPQPEVQLQPQPQQEESSAGLELNKLEKEFDAARTAYKDAFKESRENELALDEIRKTSKERTADYEAKKGDLKKRSSAKPLGSQDTPQKLEKEKLENETSYKTQHTEDKRLNELKEKEVKESHKKQEKAQSEIEKKYQEYKKAYVAEVTVLEHQLKVLKEQKPDPANKEAVATKQMIISNIQSELKNKKAVYTRIKAEKNLPNVHKIVHTALNVAGSENVILGAISNVGGLVSSANEGLNLRKGIAEEMGVEVSKLTEREILESETVAVIIRDEMLWSEIGKGGESLGNLFTGIRSDAIAGAIAGALNIALEGMHKPQDYPMPKPDKPVQLVDPVQSDKPVQLVEPIPQVSQPVPQRLEQPAPVVRQPEPEEVYEEPEQLYQPQASLQQLQMKAVQNFLSAPNALKNLALILSSPGNQTALQKFIKEHKAFQAVFKRHGIDPNNVANILPDILGILAQAGQNQSNFKGIVDLAKTAADEGKEIDAAAVLPKVTELLYGEDGIAKNVAKLLETKAVDVANLASVGLGDPENDLKFRIVLEKHSEEIAKWTAEKDFLKQDVAGKHKEAIEKFAVEAKMDKEIFTSYFNSFILDIKRASVGNPKDSPTLVREKVAKLCSEEVKASIGTAVNVKQSMVKLIPAIMSIAAKVVGNQKEMKAIMDLLPNVLEAQKNAQPGKPMSLVPVINLIPHINNLLFGEKGIASDVSTLIINDSLIPIIQQQLMVQRITVPDATIKTGLQAIAAAVGHKAELREVLNIIGSVDVSSGFSSKPTNVQVLNIGLQVMKIISSPDVVEKASTLITAENLKIVGEQIPEAAKYVTDENLGLATAVVGKVLESLPKIQTMLSSNSSILEKLVKKEDKLNKGEVDHTLKIESEEYTRLISMGLKIAIEVDPAKLIQDNKAQISNLILQTRPVLAKGISEKLSKDVVNLALEGVPLLLGKDKLIELSAKSGDIARLIDDKTPIAEKKKIVFELVDAVFMNNPLDAALMHTPESKAASLKSFYNGHVKTFLEANKDELAAMITTAARAQHINLDGHKVISALSEEKTFAQLEKVYEAYKSGSYFKMMKAGLGSTKILSLAASVIASNIRVRIADIMPNFIKRLLVNESVLNAISVGRGADWGLVTPMNLKEACHNAAVERKGYAGFIMETGDFSGLKLAIPMDKMVIEGFDFAGATLGSAGTGLNLTGSTITDCNFKGTKLNQPVAKFEDVTIDLKSFQSLLPVLQKAQVKDFTGMKVIVSPEQLHDKNMKTFITKNAAILDQVQLVTVVNSVENKVDLTKFLAQTEAKAVTEVSR